MRKLLTLLFVAGCASAPETVPLPQAAPEPAVAAALAESTAIRQSLHLVFGWTFTEENARFSGRGSTRVQAPYHARLDLFGPRGETYLAAAAVGDELRLPAGLPDAMRSVVPPVALLWSALGVQPGESENDRVVFPGPNLRETCVHVAAEIENFHIIAPRQQ